MPDVDLAKFGASAWINPPGGAIGPTTLASDTTIAPVAPITKVSGTASITTITPPYTGFVGRLTFIATGAWTFTSTGNIGTVGTMVASQAIDMVYDGATWYPVMAD